MTEEAIDKINQKVLGTNEEDFLKYLVDCCDNVLEKPHIIQGFELNPLSLQLMKMRAEITDRLKVRHKVLHGKFAYSHHLFNKGRGSGGTGA